MRKLKRTYQNLQNVVDFLIAQADVSAYNNSEDGFILDEEVNPNHFTRDTVLALMHQVSFVPAGKKREISIDKWFEKAYRISDRIEWLSEAWQFKIVLERLLREVPDEVKYGPRLGFTDYLGV